MQTPTIAFIGCGNMAGSLIGGLINDGHPAERIRAADPDPEQRRRAVERFAIEVHDRNDTAIDGADVVVLAVKPQQVPATLRESAATLLDQRPLVLSVAAGVRTQAMLDSLGGEIPLVRVMPNTPALIGAGVAALYAGAQVTPEQRDVAESIMRAVGLALWVEDESEMDAVTAVSGSGPAYFFLVMEVMEQAAVRMGLPAEQARIMVLDTAYGAARMALESELDPANLRRQVTSPGGTTEQAINVLLEQGHIDDLFARAMEAARHRSRQLAEELGQS